MGSRRDSNFSEVSVSASLLEDVALAQADEEALVIDEQLGSLTPAQRLSRLLSVRSILSTSSSFAERPKAAQLSTGTSNFREVGKGACGIVYTRASTVTVLKVAHSSKTRDLWTDYKMHSKVVEAFQKSRSTAVLIPGVLHYITYRAKGSESERHWWSLNEARFPKDAQLNDTLVSE